MGTVTLILGFIGWTGAEKDAPAAVYLSLLAFGGDGIYADEKFSNVLELRIASLTGLLATISAVFGVVAVFLGDSWKKFRAKHRTDHHVLIGGDRFVLDMEETAADLANRPLTVIVEKNTLDVLSPRLSRTSLLPVTGEDIAEIASAIGAPAHITLGDRQSVRNLQLARALSARHASPHNEKLHWRIRLEDGSIARDLELFHADLRKFEVFSAGQIIARSLVTHMAPTTLATMRQQDQVHIALIGLGSVGLAIAEELVLRCHAPDLKPLRLSILDSNPSGAIARMESERPGLYGLSNVDIADFDGLRCGEDAILQPLIELEKLAPLTALIVATGNDARNAAIATRLRQAQLNKLRLKAPIYVRQDFRDRIAPTALVDLTSRPVFFGGIRSDTEDSEIENFHEELAETLHNTWLLTQDKDKQVEQAWKKLTYSSRRSSYRAALSAVELLRSAGLRPDHGTGLAGMRLPRALADQLLRDEALILRLSQTEHERWLTEKRADGYEPAQSGMRDDEKKLHPLMRDYEDLSAADQKKDEDIVVQILERCAERYDAAQRKSVWRQEFNIDLTQGENSIETALSAALADLPLEVACYSLRIVKTIEPDTPFADMIDLAKAWYARCGRMPSFTVFETRRDLFQTSLFEEALRAAKLPKSVEVLRVDARPLGCSDADMDRLDASRRLDNPVAV